MSDALSSFSVSDLDTPSRHPYPRPGPTYSSTPGLVDSSPVSKALLVSGPETATEAPTMTYVVIVEAAEFNGSLVRLLVFQT
jgi:hypothetical protein